MGQITRMTVPMGLSLAVVAELDDLTVGGLINGYGIEGSSHIYGLFADTCVAYEIILADGRLVRATADNEFSDLFYAIPWSQGTLGLLVAAEIKLIEVGPYMKVTYKPARGDLQELAQAYNDSYIPRDGDQDNPEKVPDFVETMIYSETEGVTMTGRYASKDEAKRKGNKINCVCSPEPRCSDGCAFVRFHCKTPYRSDTLAFLPVACYTCLCCGIVTR